MTVGRVAAIGREHRRRVRPTTAALRAYERDIRTLAAHTAAILPVRFGSCFQDDDELRAVLAARQGTLRRRLRTVRGRVQMTLRAVAAVESAAQRAAPTAHVSGVAFLRARAAARRADRRVAGFELIERAVRRWVREERVETLHGVASVYHLIPAATADAYRNAVQRAAGAAQLRVVVTGPWPPYAFSSSF